LATATTLVATLALASYAAIVWLAPRPAASPGPATLGTAILGTTTCADWQRSSQTRRLALIGALGVAATQPDPENPGATLDRGAAYGVLQRACSTRAARSALLYEIYNRAASFQGARAGSGGMTGALGHP
jgi:hypothetical protein